MKNKPLNTTPVHHTPKEAEELGFAIYNENPHLAVEVPDGDFTITCRTSEGKKITLAFVGYKKGGPPRCVDVSRGDPGNGTIKNGALNHETHEVVVFGPGSTLFDSRSVEDKLRERKSFCHRALTTTILLDERTPGEGNRPIPDPPSLPLPDVDDPETKSLGSLLKLE